jgi:hypothetical protein
VLDPLGRTLSISKPPAKHKTPSCRRSPQCNTKGSVGSSWASEDRHLRGQLAFRHIDTEVFRFEQRRGDEHRRRCAQEVRDRGPPGLNVARDGCAENPLMLRVASYRPGPSSGDTFRPLVKLRTNLKEFRGPRALTSA